MRKSRHKLGKSTPWAYHELIVPCSDHKPSIIWSHLNKVQCIKGMEKLSYWTIQTIQIKSKNISWESQFKSLGGTEEHRQSCPRKYFPFYLETKIKTLKVETIPYIQAAIIVHLTLPEISSLISAIPVSPSDTVLTIRVFWSVSTFYRMQYRPLRLGAELESTLALSLPSSVSWNLIFFSFVK